MGSLAFMLGGKQLVVRCLHPWRVQALPRQDQAAQVSWWQPSCFEREVGSETFCSPFSPMGLSPGSFGASWHAVRAVFVFPGLLSAALACSGLCVTQQPRKNSHDSENPSMLLWLGFTCPTAPASWVGHCAEYKHSRGKGWLRQELVLPLS